jgi:hypothetical protein
MAKATIRGKVLEIGPVLEVGEKKTLIQNILLFTPGYHDGYDKVGRDNEWEIQLIGQKKIDELRLPESLVGSIIDAECFLDSQKVEAKPREKINNVWREATKGGHFVNVTLNKYTIVR